MCKSLLILALVANLAGLSTSAVAAPESRMVELSAPSALHPDDSIEVQISAGPLSWGSRLVVMTEQGETLGVVTPFNAPGARSGTTATVPVPRSALSDGHLRLRLQVIEQGAAPRAPKPEEFQLTFVVVPR
jgi:hypothetical protein